VTSRKKCEGEQEGVNVPRTSTYTSRGSRNVYRATVIALSRPAQNVKATRSPGGGGGGKKTTKTGGPGATEKDSTLDEKVYDVPTWKDAAFRGIGPPLLRHLEVEKEREERSGRSGARRGGSTTSVPKKSADFSNRMSALGRRHPRDRPSACPGEGGAQRRPLKKGRWEEGEGKREWGRGMS